MRRVWFRPVLDSFWFMLTRVRLVLTRFRFVLIRIELYQTRIEAWWTSVDSCWLVLTRADLFVSNIFGHTKMHLFRETLCNNLVKATKKKLKMFFVVLKFAIYWDVKMNKMQRAQRYANAYLKISLQVRVHIKLISWKFRILNPRNCRVI